jgi:hypothetical protein
MSACSAGTGSRLSPGAISGSGCRAPASAVQSALWAATRTDPEGHPIDDDAWQARHRDWLPSAEDRGFVSGLMRRVTEPGKVAGWMASPEIGINNAPLDYEYVRLNRAPHQRSVSTIRRSIYEYLRLTDPAPVALMAGPVINP